MGKFINKSYTNTIDSLTTGTIQKVKNVNYVFNNKPPVLCNWYNIDKEATTFDEGTGAEYVAIGKNSPIRYKLIKDAVFYGQGIQIELDLEYDEDGLGASTLPSISGIVLPNTWIPYQGDHFTLKQAGKEYIYRVIAVSYDTIDNNNNIYKFDAQLDQTGDSYINKQITDTYRFIVNNVGTSYNAVIKETIYDCIDILDKMLIQIKNYYISLFYNDSVQTFTYKGQYGNIYDPFMIEFLMRNDILNGSDEYIYVHHELPENRTFSIEYNDSLFRALETKTKERFTNQKCCAELIRDQYSLFASVSEEYYVIKHQDIGMFIFNPVDSVLISNVKFNEEFDINNPKSYYNIITKFFNNSPINSSIVSILERIDFKPTIDLFYSIPMIIYIIEYSIKNLMS